MGAIASAPTPLPAAPRLLLRYRSDAALAERFAAGNEAAFELLYERHRGAVLAVCMGVLGSRPDAEDAAQETFAALTQALHRSPPSNIGAWLTRVARNAAIDIARRRRGTDEPDAELPASNGEEDVRSEFRSVLDGIKQLPESQRTALLMRELAGRSYSEIASLLEVDDAAVRGLIARARMGLRSHRDAANLTCEGVRAALAVVPDDLGVLTRAVRAHVRHCSGCRAYRRALRSDARTVRALFLGPTAPIASGGAVVGGLATKGALVGGVVNQLTAACAVSVCAVGGVVLLGPGGSHHRHRATARYHAPAAAGRAYAPERPSPSRAPASHVFHARAAVAPQVGQAARSSALSQARPLTAIRLVASSHGSHQQSHSGGWGGGAATPSAPNTPAAPVSTTAAPSTPAPSQPGPSSSPPPRTSPETSAASSLVTWWERVAAAAVAAWRNVVTGGGAPTSTFGWQPAAASGSATTTVGTDAATTSADG